MDNYGFPTNIKQIGNIDENMRIYIEDNVYSYILKYSEFNKNKESIAMLIGRCMIVNDERVLFINGAIEGKYSHVKKGLVSFSGQSLKHIEEQRHTYFEGLEVVGWVLSQPCFGNFLSGGYARYHLENFDKSYQVLFVTDPVEKVHSFFKYNNQNTDIEESKGFFIYYDKNKDMVDYMSENEIKNFNIQEPDEIEDKRELDDEEDNLEKEDLKKIVNFDNSEKKVKKDVRVYKNNNRTNNKYSKINPKAPMEKRNIKDTAPLSKKILQEKNYMIDRRKIGNLYSAIAFIGVIAVFALGSNLVNNNKQIDLLNSELVEMKTSYTSILNYINEMNGDLASNEVNETSGIVEEESVAVGGSTVIVKDFDEKDKTEESTTDSTSLNQVSTTTNNSTTTTSETFVPDTYIVESGDSLLSISSKFYGTKNKIVEIMDLNSIEDADKIYTGMVLDMP
ncbi:MAG: LysM peptidoglycan-binding domain-containing protein [Lachnospirales bacterium]